MSAAADSQASPIRYPRPFTVASAPKTASETWRAKGRRRIQTQCVPAILRVASLALAGLQSFAFGCQTPVVFQGLSDAHSPLETFRSPVSDDDIAALIRHHATSAIAAATDGRLDQARAHWEAHRALLALVEDGASIDAGVDPKEWASLASLLEADEVEPDENEGVGRSSPEGLQAAIKAPVRDKRVNPSGKPAGVATATVAGFLTPPPMVAAPPPVSTAAFEGTRPPDAETNKKRTSAPPPQKAVDRDAWLEGQVRRILIEFGEDRRVKPPAAFLKQVRRVVDGYTSGAQRRLFQKALHRMDKYLPTIHGIFSERRLPESFYYMALVESAFDPNARSRAGAVGLWQFMPATARRYGLTVRRGLDERRDPRKATRAAREYLLDLVLEFGAGHSMLLAMAAYNAGEGRVRNRLRKLRDYRNRNFWTLAQRKLLPAETRRYVPTVIAAAVVGRNRRRFGFTAAPVTKSVKRVELRRPVSIPYLLRASRMAEASLLALNPDLDTSTGVTPADTRFQLVLPAEVAARLEHDPVLLAARRPPPPRPAVKKVVPARPVPAERYLTYQVQATDSWRTISEWSGVSEARLRKDNPRAVRIGLRPGHVVYVKGASPDRRRVRHVVERGDTLPGIGRRYRVPVRWLMQWNGLRNRRLRAGQRLVIYVRADRKNTPVSRSATGATAPLTYRVMPNDTWWKIAQWSGVGQQSLRRFNPSAAQVGLRPGQTIVLTGAPKDLRRFEHVVRAQETLQRIAKRYRTEPDRIRQWNGLSSDRISVGRRLVIYTRVGGGVAL